MLSDLHTSLIFPSLFPFRTVQESDGYLMAALSTDPPAHQQHTKLFSSSNDVYSRAAENLPSALAPIHHGDVCESMSRMLSHTAPSAPSGSLSPGVQPRPMTFRAFPAASALASTQSYVGADKMPPPEPRKAIQDAWAILKYSEDQLASLRQQLMVVPDDISETASRSVISGGRNTARAAFNIAGPPDRLDDDYESRLVALKSEAQRLYNILDAWDAALPVPKPTPVFVDAGEASCLA